MKVAGERKHCVQALLLLLLALGLVAALLLIPWWNRMSFYDTQQEQASERLAAYFALLDQKSQLEERLSTVVANLNSSELYFRSATAELAGAELQRRIKSLVDTTDAKLVSTQNLGVSNIEGQTKIAVRVRLSGDMDALMKILYELEAETPVTIIENLSMRAKRISIRRNRQREIEHTIDINFDLTGFLRMGSQ